MTSYQIYKADKIVNFEQELKGDFISGVEVSETESELAKEKINNLKNILKSPILKKSDEKESNKYILNYSFNLRLPGEQHIWIPQEISLYKGKSNVILISKSQGNISYLIEKHLQKKSNFQPYTFTSKQLMSFWNSFKKYFIKEGYTSVLQRFILENAYLESSLVKELNIKAKDAEDVGMFTDLVKSAKKFKAITLQIKWNLSDENGKRFKPMTVRIGIAGSVLIYGNHPSQLIQILINAIDSII